jgi:hypothetical protein
MVKTVFRTVDGEAIAECSACGTFSVTKGQEWRCQRCAVQPPPVRHGIARYRMDVRMMHHALSSWQGEPVPVAVEDARGEWVRYADVEALVGAH